MAKKYEYLTIKKWYIIYDGYYRKEFPVDFNYTKDRLETLDILSEEGWDLVKSEIVDELRGIYFIYTFRRLKKVE